MIIHIRTCDDEPFGDFLVTLLKPPYTQVTPNTPFAFTSVPAAKCCLTALMFPLRRSIVN